MRAGASGGTLNKRRLAVGVLVALVSLVSWDQTGVLSVGAATSASDGPVMPATKASAAVSGFEALAARLRVGGAPAEATPESVPAGLPSGAIELAAPPPAPLGDLAIAPPPPSFAGRVSAPAPPTQLAPSRYDPSTASGGTWALLIGVNDYPGLRYDLRSAVNDAEDVNAALAKLGVTNDRRMVLRDRQASADTIRAALDWLTAHAGPGSTMVLFFAGHVQRLEPGREAIVGSDGGVVPDTEVAAMLDRSQASQAWIGIAACYGGGFDEVVRTGRILTAAAPSDRVAYENEGFGRSYLVEYMVRRGMLGQGIPTVEGAFAWAVAELQRDYPDRLPVQLDAVGGDLDLRTGTPPPEEPSEPPPSSSPPPSSPPPSKDGCAALTVGVVRCS